MGHEPSRVVDEGDEVGLPQATAVAELGPVHHVAHPEVAGALVLEAASILARGGVGGARHQAVPLQHAMHGGERERHVRRHALLLPRGRDDQRDAIGRVLLFERAQLIGTAWGRTRAWPWSRRGCGLRPSKPRRR